MKCLKLLSVVILDKFFLGNHQILSTDPPPFHMTFGNQGIILCKIKGK